MVPKRARFKDWQSNLINDIQVEKLLKKVIEFESLMIQIRINLDLQTDHNKTLEASETSSANNETCNKLKIHWK